ncbi:helix-turn-helix domain-containing protein [Amycolatopsis sp. NPDC004169]|uniref:helix-turn-helix domain-containing protein n=1 Tax=Amycolatopsis sp. NPDC004169 TaxID=3154453 RepID=UPI0033A15073
MAERWGASLRRYRTRAGLTQEQLAEAAGVSIRTLRRWETGDGGHPHGPSVRRVARVLDLTGGERDRLLALADEPDPTAGRAVAPPRLRPFEPGPFVGREAELDALTAHLTGTPCRNLVVVDGPRGIGKTFVALRWADRQRGAFPDGQLYADLWGSRTDLASRGPSEVLHDFLLELGVTPEEIPGGAEERAALYRTVVAGKRLLVVLDDARDSNQVRLLLPESLEGAVLITGRHRLNGLVAGSGAGSVTLGPLPEAAARQLLAASIGADRATGDGAGELLEFCGGQPLVLYAAAARAAAHPERDLHEVTGELRELAAASPALHDRTSGLAAVLGEYHPDVELMELGSDLMTQAYRLNDLGRPDAALSALTDAEAVYRQLDRQTPRFYRAGPLADCLMTKSLQLLDLGFVEEAVRASAESVELRRPGDDDLLPTGAVLRMLASSLGNHAMLLCAVGRPEEAVAALTEGVELRKRFVAAKQAGRTVSSRG